MNFSFRIKELREERGLSQARLAKELGVGVGSVGMWESTQEIPPVKKLVKIADYFHVTLDYLVGRSDMRVSPDGEALPEEALFLSALRTLNPAQKELLSQLIATWRG